MKRCLCLILSLILAFSLSLPALAASDVTAICGDGPVRLGVGYDSGGQAVIYYSSGSGWQSAQGCQDAASASPRACYTGRDYFLYTAYGATAYTSSDGIHWTQVEPRHWLEEGTLYGPASNQASKEYQLVWADGVYMLRQSLLDDPRDTHSTLGNSLRNHMVLFLDESYQVVGAKGFDAPVTAIRYADGTYYATVNGAEQSFTRADWDPGQEGGNYYSGTAWTTQYGATELETPTAVTQYIIREQLGNPSPFGLAVSTDGRSWLPLETHLTPDMTRISDTQGGAVICYNSYGSELWYYQYTRGLFGEEPTQGWVQADPGFDPTQGISSPRVNYTLRWTGTGYLMCQSVSGGGMMGQGADETSPYNSRVVLLDANFHKVSEYDLGGQVTGVSYYDNTCYAQVGGGADAAVYASADGITWTLTDRNQLPQTTLAPQGEQVRTFVSGDVSDGQLIYRLTDGQIQCSVDGVYFLPLTQTDGVSLAVHPCEGGAVVQGLDEGGFAVTTLAVDRAQTSAAWAEQFPDPLWYATLDGDYVGTDDVPFYRKGGIMMAPLRVLAETLGFTVTWDEGANAAVCVKGDQTLTVYLGTTRAVLNGEEKPMALPSEVHQQRTCISIRYVAEAFGLTIAWDEEGHTIHLFS